MCTNFLIKVEGEDKGIVVGRSMENVLPIGNKLFFRTVDFTYEQKLQPLTEKITLKQDVMDAALSQWTGKYGFVAMQAQTTGLAANGMNTEGLTVGDMTLSGTEYQSIKNGKDKKTILYPYLVNWILSNFSTCKEVSTDLLENIRVVNPYNEMSPGFLFHFPVTDKDGNSIVIEYIDGKVKINDNTIPGTPGVLTNDPTFSWQLKNLKNYVSVTPLNQGNDAKLTNNFSIKSPWQGSGFSNLPGSSTPPDRFVRAAMMTNYAYPVTSLSDATTLAFHILNTVDIPYGTSRLTKEEREQLNIKDNQTAGDYTLWVTVANLSELIFSIRLYESPQVFSVDLNKIDLSKLSNINTLNYELPSDWPKSIDITNTINDLSN